jgi:hypothetical protein
MRRVTKALVTGVITGLAATALAGVGASPAGADTSGGAGGGGAYAEASIRITVTGGTGKSYSSTKSVPATCWWEPFELGEGYGFPPVDPNDPESVEKYFEAIAPLLSGHAAGGRLELPDGDYLRDIIRRVASGEKLTFYEAKCVEGKNAVSEGLIPKSGTWQGVDFGVRFRAFPPGDPPGPVVPAEVLADLAREELTFANPEVDYNPKVQGALATLVGLPTWFWVTNQAAALGDGPEGIGSARAVATAGGDGDPFSQAIVEAKNGGMTVSAEGLSPSPKTCELAEIRRAYTAGAEDAGACTATFQRASVGTGNGFAVTVTTNFDVSWNGTEANGTQVGPFPIALDADPTTVLNVPVAEEQAIVTGGR